MGAGGANSPIVHDVSGAPGANVTVQARKSNRTVDEWREISYHRAFDGTFGTWAWNENTGWESTNQGILRKLYDYYGALNKRQPDKFHWPGLGKLAGGTVYGGLDMASMTNVFGSPSDDKASCVFIGIAKKIFEDVAWQFEAYDAEGMPELDILLPDYDRAHQSNYPCYPAWQSIDKGGTDAVEGSHKLLSHEQNFVIDQGYKLLQRNILINRARAITPCPHPYGRDFIIVEPQGDLFKAEDRWDWIEKDMWPTWTALPPEERRRLIDLRFDDIVKRDFFRDSPPLQLYMPPGDQSAGDD